MTNWHTHLYAVIRHPVEPNVLLLRGDDGWKLPYIHHPDKIWSSSVAIVTSAFCKLIKTHLWALRQIYFESDHDTKLIEAIFEMELIDPQWELSPHAHWIDKTEFHENMVLNEKLYARVDAYLCALEEGIVPFVDR